MRQRILRGNDARFASPGIDPGRVPNVGDPDARVDMLESGTGADDDGGVFMGSALSRLKRLLLVGGDLGEVIKSIEILDILCRCGLGGTDDSICAPPGEDGTESDAMSGHVCRSGRGAFG